MPEADSDLMSEFRKLQSETTGIRSLFAEKSLLDIGNLIENKLAKDIHDFCEKTIELQDKFNKEVMEQLEFDKLQTRETLHLNQEQLNKTVQDRLDLIEQNIFRSLRSEMTPNRAAQSAKNTDSNMVISPPEVKSSSKKEILISATFHNIPELQKYDFPQKESFKVEEHFGVPFGISIFRRNGFVNLVVCVTILGRGGCKSLKGHCEIEVHRQNREKFVSKTWISMTNCNYYWYWENFMSWDEMKKDFMIDGKVDLDVHFRIEKWKGEKIEKRRKFDEEKQSYSDTILFVKGKKFYVFKLLLAAQSTYFNSLLSDSTDESEIPIDDVDPEDFHVFLEVLYGEPLEEITVETNLLLAEQFDSKVVTHRCEEFLIKKSEKTLKKKFQLATRYKLELLKINCIASIKSTSDVQSIIPRDLMDMDQSVLAALLEKTLHLGHS